MFTGLVEATGQIVGISPEPPGLRLTIEVAEWSNQSVQLGDSICIQGCCLTVVAVDAGRLEFEAGAETLSKTVLGKRQVGDRLNLERSLQVGQRLGGHFVTGHVDGLGRVRDRRDDGQWSNFWFDCPPQLRSHLAPKGSIAIDGVSLTVVEVDQTGFSVALIPHTLSVTTLGELTPGDDVHLESDILAKYVERQLQERSL
jgi:riboflavin synthase